MLDDLLGRTALKERIDTLEEERDRLERRLAAETERRKEAVRDRQTADERVNRLEDRIAELEDRVERSQEGETQLDFHHVERLRGDRTRSVLDRLRSVEAGSEGAFTAMLEDEPPPQAVREAFGERVGLLTRASPCLALTDDAAVISAALAPPLPPDPFTTWEETFRLDRAWFLPTGRFAFALVRSDLFALGEYEGSDRHRFEGFESDVMGEHSKGGFSQARFERRRSGQIDEHLRRARSVIEDRTSDRLIVVGERTVITAFADEAVRTAAVGATGRPEPALEDAFRAFWTTRLYGL